MGNPLGAERLDLDKRRKITGVAVRIVFAQQGNVARLIHIPVILLQLFTILRGDEDQIGEQPSRSAIAVRERVNSDLWGS